MQKFNVDVQRPSVPLVVYAKQQDTVRKVELTLYENGVPFVPPDGAVASVWYKTPAGVGNYTDNITISGNKIELTLIEQMLTNAGNGIACVVLHDVDKAKLGLWNMEIVIEGVPALDSAVASEWFTAFDEKVSQALDAAQKAKAEADRAETAANNSDWVKQLGGSTVIKNTMVTANLTEETPLHCVTEFAPTGGGGTPEKPIPIVGTDKLDLTVCGENLCAISTNIISSGTEEFKSFPAILKNKPVCTVDFDSVITTAGAGATPDKLGLIVDYDDGREVYFRQLFDDDVNLAGKVNHAHAVINEPTRQIKKIYFSYGVRGTGRAKIENIVVRDGLHPKNDYVSYTGETYTVNLGETASGSYDWNSGTLTRADGSTKRLTPQQPLSVDGTNNIFSSTGDTEVSRQRNQLSAKNSDKLNGKTESQLSVDNSAKLGGKLPSELAVNMDILWANASPTSEFADQTIDLLKPIGDYQRIVVICKINAEGNFEIPPVFLTGEYNGYIEVSRNYTYSREIYLMAKSVRFAGCFYKSAYNSYPDISFDSYIIPLTICGIK